MRRSCCDISRGTGEVRRLAHRIAWWRRSHSEEQLAEEKQVVRLARAARVEAKVVDKWDGCDCTALAHRPGSRRWFVVRGSWSGVDGGVSRVEVCSRARLIGRFWRGNKQKVTTELQKGSGRAPRRGASVSLFFFPCLLLPSSLFFPFPLPYQLPVG